MGCLCHQQLCGATKWEAWLGRVQTVWGAVSEAGWGNEEGDDSLGGVICPQIATEDSLTHCLSL